MISSRSLLDQISTYAEHHGVELPVISPVATGLMLAVQREDVTAADVEAIVQSDQALAAEVLRASNSAFYGGLASVTTVQGAIFRLGLEQVARLVLLATERNRYAVRQPRLKKMMATLWMHASACANAAEWLARRLGHRDIEEEAFVGALMHDIGKLYMLRVLDEMVSNSREAFDTPEPFLLELLEVAHTSQGFQLVSNWHIPEVYGVIVRDHHLELPDPTNVALLLIRLANRACRKLGIGLTPEPQLVLSILPEAAMLLTGEVMLAELEVLLEDTAADLASRSAA